MTAKESTALAPTEPESVSGLVALAINKGVDVEVLERLVALQERVTLRDAEVAMARALVGFQEDCPPIRRVSTATITKNGVRAYEYNFAPLDEIVRVIRPVLAKYGLSYTHDGSVEGSNVETVCTLQHVEGAKRTATFRGPIDTSGGKNPIQQVSSARSYGRRYTLMDVLGLTTEDDDDGQATDAAASGGGQPGDKITEGQAADLQVLLLEVGADKAKFLKWLKVESISDIPVEKYREAVAALEQKRRAV